MEIIVLASKYNKQHFQPLEDHFSGRYIYEESYSFANIIQHNPLLVICFDEHYCELGNVIGSLKEQGIATLQIMDGILEWRRTWDYTREGHQIDGVANPLNQPALSHKIACLGRRDARVLESWGNLGKCEIVGAPRFDEIVRRRLAGESANWLRNKLPRILVMTAKTPGFTPEQIKTTKKSLADLHDYFSAHPELQVVWRLTRGLEQELGVKNKLSDLAGNELHSILAQVDAVITTPSTAILESMLFERPVALLDYHNTPHYFEAVWTISSEDHIEQVINELVSPPQPKTDYQRFLLEEQLACQSPARDRMITLIETMVEAKRASHGKQLELPFRIIDDPSLFVNSPLPLSKLKAYYPALPVPDDIMLRELQVELAAARGTIEILYERVAHLERRLTSIPGYKLLKSAKRMLGK